MLRKLKSKDLKNYLALCLERDKYSDFYIVENEKRNFVNEPKNAKRFFKDALKRDKFCLVNENKGEITGVLFVVNQDGKKYVKVFSFHKKVISNLLKVLYWNIDKDLYIETKKYNPVFQVATNIGFREINTVDKYRVLLERKNKFRENQK